jgi:hypothetical protein
MDRERAWSVRFAIARALSQSDFSEHLTGRFEARSAETRASACFLASWLLSPDPFAPQIRRCLDDVEETVIKTAIDALDRLRQRSVCADLAERVRTAITPEQRWVYLDALVDAIDPGDGFRPWPSILSKTAEWVHPFARRYLNEQLDRRCKALADDLKKKNK